jgi:hypothetical protein
MRQALKLHPDSVCEAIARIDVDVARPRPGVLALLFSVTGALGGLRMPAATRPTRADGLWRRTCFEAFLAAAPGGPYYELNFAPSTQWAAYRFSGYRAGMSVADEISTPRIDVRSDAEHFQLEATVDLDRALSLPKDAPWRVGLSAVIEETSGGLSYWALAHPPGKADFHHSDCFAVELPATGRS